MVDPKHQLFLNISPKGAEKRILFAHIAWVCLTFFGVIVGLVKGAPLWLGAFSGIVFILPVLVWAIGRGGKLGELFDDVYIASWGCVSLCAMAIGGGVLSPLTGMLVLGPLACVMLGRLDICIHTAVLGVFAYAIAIFMSVFGWAEAAPSGWQALVGPLGVVALVQVVIFIWAIEPQIKSLRMAEYETGDKRYDDRMPMKDISGTLETSQASALDGLDLTLPMLLIGVAPEGRIRRMEGNLDLQWPDLAVGKPIDGVLSLVDGESLLAPSGERYKLIEGQGDDGGRWIGVLPFDNEPAEKDALKVKLEQAIEQIEESKAALSDRTAFFAGLGHDLKTPLNAILGFSDLMKAEVRGPLPDAYKDYPAIIHESGQDLMLLVDDILDLAKAEASSHRLDMEPIDLVASASSIVRQLSDQAERAGVKLVLKETEEVWAEADARAVRQIWQNLVSNAIKYSNEGGTVTLSAAKSAGAVAISVKDRGAGMSQSDLERVAKPFSQGDNSKGRAGTGLGLAVVNRFAQLHGGKVMIDTEQGKGTRVRVTLPALDVSRLEALEEAAE